MDIRLIFKYYWPHLKKYKKSTGLVFISYTFAVVGSGMMAPILYKRIIDIVSGSGNLADVSTTLINTVFFLGGVLLLYNLFYRIADYAMTHSQSHMLKNVADDAFARIERHSYEFFSNTFTGTLVAKVRRYVNAFETMHDQFIYAVWMNGLRLLFGLAVLSYFSLYLGMVLFIWLVLYVGITALFVKKKIKKDLLTAEANSRTTGVLSDAITNMLNVKMFASHARELSYFTEATDVEEKRRRDAGYFQNTQFLFQGYFISLFEFVGMFTAVHLWLSGLISAGTIILMQIYIFTSFDVVWNIGRNSAKIMRALAEAKEMVDIFEKPVAVKDPLNPEECKISKGEIEIKNISFLYKEEEARGTSVFKRFSLHIASGEKVGLVGPSGAGKTTITKLLLRFADVQDGKILIDGQDISQITQKDLRSQIAYVPQDPILFHRTLKENISYSNPEASEKEIINAAKRSHAHEFIKNSLNGYDTYVGERGIKLSGGERQRVAIARAMLKGAPILILDEATSSLDSISEQYIQEAFDELMKGRTTLVIAHRLSTIQKMDRIIVFDKGAIVEDGTHKELIAKKGLYYRLWKQQSHGFMGE
ncbi:MAG: ABC transporter ATP-binding protein [bacterium]|nr:ABC transporter ATP-binding protein [bacterium]